MFYLYNNRYSLERIQLTISDEIKLFSSCSDLESPPYKRRLYINCASWNASKSQIYLYVIKMYAWKEIKLMFFRMMSLFKIYPKNNYKYNVNSEETIYFTGKYITWDNAIVCSITNAQCFQIYKYCVCHCLPGYIMEDANCLKSIIKFLFNNNYM